MLVMSDPVPTRNEAAADAIAAVTGRRAPEAAPAPVDDGTWTDADLESCAAEATAASQAASERQLIAVSTNSTGLGGPSSDMVKMSAYLRCNITHKPLHLCKGYWHDKILDDIKEYAAAFREVSNQAYWTNYSVLERGRRDGTVEEDFWQTISDDIRQTTREMAEMHDEITQAFRARITDGIISPDEFGVFLGIGIPPDIARMIGGAEPVRDVCG